jgi:hypothetical protein
MRKISEKDSEQAFRVSVLSEGIAKSLGVMRTCVFSLNMPRREGTGT